MRMIKIGRVCGPGGRRWRTVAVAGLAACGIAGALPSAALAGSSQVPSWTKQHPATHPSGRQSEAMAYDAATGNLVLFGGANDKKNLLFHDTWSWG
jgi:hypothetical protein